MRTNEEHLQAMTQAKENLADLNERGADAGGCSLGDRKQIALWEESLSE